MVRSPEIPIDGPIEDQLPEWLAYRAWRQSKLDEVASADPSQYGLAPRKGYEDRRDTLYEADAVRRERWSSLGKDVL